MALLHIEGFDHYTVSNANIYNLSDLWVAGAGGGGEVTTISAFGSQGIALPWATDIGSSVNRCPILFTLPKSIGVGETLGVGMNVYITAYPSSNSMGCLIGLSNGSLETYICVALNTSGNLCVKSAPNATAWETSSEVFPLNTPVHLEIQWYIHGSSGTVTIFVNGEEHLTVTGRNTLPNNSDVSRLGFGGRQLNTSGNATRQFFFDDLFVYDGTGSMNNSRIGPMVVSTLFPNEIDSPQEWVVEGAADAVEAITTLPAAPSTRYIEADTDDLKSVFGLEELEGEIQTIAGVQVTTQAYKTGTAAVDYHIGLIVGSTEDNASVGDLSGSAGYKYRILETNPDTEAAWAVSDLDDAKLVVGGA